MKKTRKRKTEKAAAKPVETEIVSVAPIGESGGGEDKPESGDNPGTGGTTDPGETPGSGDTPETPEPDPGPEHEPDPVQPPSYDDFQHVPVSHLEPLPRGFRLSGDELFLVSQPVLKDGKTAGYVSKSIKYSTLARNISADMKFGVKDDDYSGTVQYVKDVVEDPRHPIPSVISSITEDSKGRITGVGGYALSNALTSILDKVTLPKIDATDSPWLRKTQVTQDLGASQTLVASQKLVNSVSATANAGFLKKESVTSEPGTRTDLAASQKLVTDISTQIETRLDNLSDKDITGEYVRKSQVKSERSESTTDVASIGFATKAYDLASRTSMAGDDGQVYYISKDGGCVKQTILDLSSYVCESDEDIKKSFPTQQDKPPAVGTETD